ncbi:tetratricopeptide repeat protein [Porphyromonas gingivicanis]|uniref:tetratricopeptide repeat protein n=1 Tax=Porphyromonas gingivicanis TaxID=266762 RepID=UPI001F5A83FE|nr:tetratricopeptide repeat protein [Porphyromonas gingivicanis]
MPSCAKKQQVISTEERRAVDSVIRSQKGCEELEALQKKWEDEGNQLGSLSVLREWGKKLRDESRFDEALKVHSKGLMLAEQLNDTLEMVQALNNIGTNYRRLGVLDVATEYHYKAWKLSEEHSDTSYMAKKNEVISLNGLGNIYMTLGNYERADSAFRKALRGEEILKSTIGKAINYANIGAVFELQGQVDSAWVYYRRSMELNQKANNTLGISLCYIYFGHLYEESEDYLSANEAYRAATNLWSLLKMSGMRSIRLLRWPVFRTKWGNSIKQRLT